MPRSRIIGTVATVALLVVVLLVVGGNGLLGSGPSTGPTVSSTAAATRSASSGATSTTARDPESGLRFVELAALPVEARRTVALIEAGGPFPYAKDGVTFGNRERILPAESGGYYREYTVPTPGEGDRGARRIVTGDHDRQLFYTGDHYASFARIRR